MQNIIEDYIRNVTFVNSVFTLVQLSRVRYALEDLRSTFSQVEDRHPSTRSESR